jgi:hypothetical protein
MSCMRFPSLCHGDKYGYLMQSPSFRHHADNGFVAPWAYFYDTYGDGYTQHSGELLVPTGMFADYLASLAAHLVEIQDRDSLQQLAEFWPSRYHRVFDRKKVLAAIKVRYKEDKKQYYHRDDDYRVSTAESYRHDKRWEEVETWMNGQIDAVYAIIQGNRDVTFSCALEIYVVYNELTKYAEMPRSHGQDVSSLRKEFDNQSTDDIQLSQAFWACEELVQVARQRASAERHVERIKSNLQWYRDQRAAKAEAQAASA